MLPNIVPLAPYKPTSAALLHLSPSAAWSSSSPPFHDFVPPLPAGLYHRGPDWCVFLAVWLAGFDRRRRQYLKARWLFPACPHARFARLPACPTLLCPSWPGLSILNSSRPGLKEPYPS